MLEPTPPVDVVGGISFIAVPTPFIVGRVNAYLCEGDPLTLIDTGPNTATSFDELERSLQSVGRSVEEIGRVILTHQHVDHIGLAAIIKRRSGAEIVGLSGLGNLLSDWTAASQRDDQVGGALLRANGLSEQALGAMSSVSRAYRAFGASVTVDTLLEENDVVEIAGREFTVLHRPGHSPSDTIFHNQSERLLIGADHLLKAVSSNPLISAPLDPTADLSERPKPLPEYLENLGLTKALDVDLVLPGHGNPFTDHAAVIDERFRMHERRAAKLLAALSDRPLSAFELAEGLWGNIAYTQTFLALSEVVGHMDLLEVDGAVTELPADSQGVVRYQAN